jgi:tRNA(Phe) wybutosine-synthesizing methylase Tyw3
MVAKPGKFLIELQGNQGIALPVKKGKSALVEKKHLRYILRRANEKLAKNYRHLKKLEREFAEALK